MKIIGHVCLALGYGYVLVLIVLFMGGIWSHFGTHG
jgi:hypothetical protein